MTVTLPNSERPGTGYSQDDWDDVSDNPELTEAEIAALRPVHEIPEIFDLLPKRGRGRPKLADAKVNLTLRVEPDVIARYKATGPGWQTRMSEALANGIRSGSVIAGLQENIQINPNYFVVANLNVNQETKYGYR